ncbi:MAG: hypothetical protein KatS3mg008_1145 [Acidimicrobiales bacterium]|nr:MAG: hypothetical protein KatS3mg008_1145 [Acidimicrobiales bacterium]
MDGERLNIRRLFSSPSRDSVGLATRLRIRYWIVMVVVVALAVFTLQTHNTTVRSVALRQQQIAAMVQMRTLLQQVRALAHSLAERVDDSRQSPSPVEVDQFSNLVEQMRSLHADLRDARGSVPPLEDKEVIALFESSTTAIRTRTDAFLTAASSLPTFLSPGQASASRRQDILLQLDRLADPVNGPLYSDFETVIKTLNERIDQIAEDANTSNQVFAVAWLMMAGMAVAVAFRPIARAVDQETTELREAERRQRESVERQIFHNELNQALEGAENEEEILEAVGRAVQEIVPDNPAELLLIDATQAHLRQAKVHPSRGAPNCPVDSPHACAAIRRGQSVRYQTSRALNVCPKLTQHEAAPCSAVCRTGRLPGTFNRRSPRHR